MKKTHHTVHKETESFMQLAIAQPEASPQWPSFNFPPGNGQGSTVQKAGHGATKIMNNFGTVRKTGPGTTQVYNNRGIIHNDGQGTLEVWNNFGTVETAEQGTLQTLESARPKASSHTKKMVSNDAEQKARELFTGLSEKGVLRRKVLDSAFKEGKVSKVSDTILKLILYLDKSSSFNEDAFIQAYIKAHREAYKTIKK